MTAYVCACVFLRCGGSVGSKQHTTTYLCCSCFYPPLVAASSHPTLNPFSSHVSAEAALVPGSLGATLAAALTSFFGSLVDKLYSLLAARQLHSDFPQQRGSNGRVASGMARVYPYGDGRNSDRMARKLVGPSLPTPASPSAVCLRSRQQYVHATCHPGTLFTFPPW